MKKTLLFIIAGIIALASCKKKNDEDPAPAFQLSVSKQGSYKEQFLNNTDTIDIVFTASGKDYTVEYLGEKRVYYPAYDSSMIVCNDFSYHAFYLTDNATTFLVAKGVTVTRRVVFNPISFSFQIANFTMDCSSGTCFPMMNCVTQNSNGIGNFKSLIQFKVDGVTRSVEVNASSKQNVMVL